MQATCLCLIKVSSQLTCVSSTADYASDPNIKPRAEVEAKVRAVPIPKTELAPNPAHEP